MVGISGYSFHIFSAALQEKLSASISQTLSMINLNMVSEIEKYQYLCGSICISEEIKKGLLKKDMTDMEKNQAMLEIQNMIRNKIIYPAQAKNISVYDTDGNIFYDLGYDGFYQEDVDRILSQLEEQDQDVWAYVHTYRDRNILVLGRRIYEHYSKSRVIGYTLISIEEKIFSKTVLEPVGLSDSSNIMYMNLDGTVLSSWNRSIALGEKTGDELLKKIQERLPKKTSSFSIQEDGEDQLVTYIFNKNLNQLFVYTMPYHYINSEVYAMLKHILVVVVFLVLLCIVIVAMVYQGIMSPIKRMLEFCREVSGGKLSVRIQDKHKDELSRLSGSMDHMADTIEHLMDQQKSQEKKKRELELQMLQYQLNPHFLFNTLNSLRFVAAMHKDQIVSDGIQALSSLLQNTLTNKNEYITIQEELENLRNPVLASLRQAPIYVQTFGNFEIFVHGKAVHFSRKKAKECLAYLIDRNGANVETAELSAILWDASENSHSLQKQVQTVISCMLRALREAGAEEIIRKNWGSMAIDVALVECDYYHLLHGDAAAVQAFSGEYMTNYRWAEGTAGFLYEKYAHESVRA